MKHIIAITKDKIFTAVVSPNEKKKIGITHEFGWKPETLDLTFSEIINKFKVSNFRILISDDLSYVVRLSVPSEVKRDEERNYIWQEIKEKIPEELEENDWDYKEISLTKDSETADNEKDVIVFALVRDFFANLVRAVKKSGLVVEAIEPEMIAKTRDVNPLVGLAMKEDISGRDEDVLNLKISITTDTADQLSKGKVNEISAEDFEKSSKLKKTIILLLILIVAINLVIVSLWIYKNYFLRKNSSNNPAENTLIQDSSPIQEPSPTGEPELTEKPTDVSGYRIQILNGSGIEGEAASVLETLTFEGFTNIDTGNAESSDFSQTEIMIKEGVPQEVYDKIDKALNSDYDVILSEDFLEVDSVYDAVVTVGERKEGS